ncbi:M24 family metallopeptidase, partial [Burkholderia contaminans]|nr:M24 family metallopeptidase [Burkholderia contaminans]
YGLKTVFETAEFDNLTPRIQRMRLIKSADEVQKMMVAGLYADKAVHVGFDNISLDKTETDIIAQIDFAMKREGYEMSFDTMVLTGDNAANPHGIPAANKVENDALLLFDLGVLVNGYASDMTRTVA